MNKIFYTILILLAIAGSVFYVFKRGPLNIEVEDEHTLETFLTPIEEPTLTWKLQIGEKIINLLVADTPGLQQRGLSGRESLPTDSGMLFVFERPDLYEMWMKDMKFSLDIMWLNDHFEIVHYEENISPDTFPNTFGPPVPSLYVLETNSGFVSENNLAVGNVLNITK